MTRPLLLLILTLLPLLGQARVYTGIEQLCRQDFAPLKGKNIVLLTNQTGVDSRLNSTIDLLHNAPQVNLIALLAPEHGVRGDITAGASVGATTDQATGLKVHSLYGRTRRPTAEMLRGADAVVYDLQDIGCRSYTFISTLGKVMEGCIENGVELIVLDRPNPLGGLRVEGPMTVNDAQRSFVSQYDIPYVYGLTVGELARWLNHNLYGSKCRLSVIAMDGWRRAMTFDQTGLPWVATSPNIPTAQTAMFYPATGILGELGTVSIGANYTMPFRVAVAQGVDARRLSEDLNALSLPGVRFRPLHLRLSGKEHHGVEVHLLQPDSVHLSSLQFHIINALKAQGFDPYATPDATRLQMFDKVCGTPAIRRAADPAKAWTDAGKEWSESIAPFLLYE